MTSKIREFGKLNKDIHEVPRLVFRNVTSSTNVRGIIACILPKHSFVPNSATIVAPKFLGSLVFNDTYFNIISYLTGVFNSFTFDFIIRKRVSVNLNYYFVYQTPVPSNIHNLIAQEIIKKSGILSSVDNRLQDLRQAIGINPKSISMNERIELCANLDALIAHQYGLTRDEYSYIINTFEGFKEDNALGQLIDIKWSDLLIRKFNGEVRKRALKYYDDISNKME